MNGLGRLALVGLIVLGCASVAGAECGWILWGLKDPRDQEPTPVNSYSTRNDCMDGMERVAKQAKDLRRQDPALRCWPGAFDPRPRS